MQSTVLLVLYGILRHVLLYTVQLYFNVASLFFSCSEEGALGYLKQSKEYRENHMNCKPTVQSSLPTTPQSSTQAVSLYVANIPRSVSKVGLSHMNTV